MGVELTWQPPNVIFSSCSTRIGIPAVVDIVVLSGEIFSTCFFLQCRNIGPKLTFCIFLLISHKLSPPILNNFNIYDIVLVIFGKEKVLACYIWEGEGLGFSKWPGLFS